MAEINSKREIELFIIDGIFYEKHIKTLSEDGYHDVTNPKPFTNLSFNDFDLMRNQLINFGGVKNKGNINIHIIDENLKTTFFYTDEGKSFFAKILELKKDPFIFLHNCKWCDFYKKFNFNFLQTTYIFMTPQKFINDYYFFNYLNLKICPNFFILHSAVSLLQVNEARNPYNIFGNLSDEDSRDLYDREVSFDKKSIDYIIENGVTCCNYLKKAGILNKERFIQVSIPCWCLNVKSIFINGIIMEHEFLQPYKIVIEEILSTGKTSQEKFLENAQYRFNVLELMCKTLCNYAIYTKKVLFVENPTTFNLNTILEI
jgi:hypothetical protein